MDEPLNMVALRALLDLSTQRVKVKGLFCLDPFPKGSNASSHS